MRKTFGLTALTAVSLLCAAAGTAAGSEAAPADETACANWDLSGQWTFFQSNEASPVFQLELTDTGLQGTGGFGYLVDSEPCPFFAACGKDPVYVSSSVDGTVTGNELELTSYWSDGSIGVYSGKVNAQGRIEGTTFDRQHPQTMASWYSDHTAKCLDGTSGSGGAVGTTSSALKTAPAEKPVRVARRGPVVPPANSMKITAIPVCDAAKNAHERNSPAALTLDGICRSRQASIEPGNVTAAAGPASSTRVTPVETKTTGLSRVNAGTRVVPNSTVAAGRINPAPAAAAAAGKVAMPYSLLRKDSRFGTVAAPGMALGTNQPENSIQVRVSYPKQFGYKTTKGPGGIFGPSSCDDFSVNATVGDGSSQKSSPTRISTDWMMADAGDSYICSYLVSDLPLDQPVNIHVDVSDRVGPWLGNGQIQPPPGEQRVVANGSQTVTLKAIQNRARLNYDMTYGPLPGH